MSNVKEENIIVKMKFGSVLYGTNTPESDTDIKGVFMPDAKDIVLQRAPKNIQFHTGDSVSKNTKDDIDCDMYSLHYFLQLVAEGQVVALDMLFAPEEMIEQTSVIWKIIQKNRDKLICKNTKAFVGYCRTQAAKYGIKGSRIAIIKKCQETINAISEEIATDMKGSGNIDEWKNVSIKNYMERFPKHDEYVRNFICEKSKRPTYEICGRKFQDTTSLGTMTHCLEKILINYGERAFLAAKNEGIDWKAVSHAFRVCYEVLELLKTHKITFPLAQREFIKDIKCGNLHFVNDLIAEKLEDLMAQVEKAAIETNLPEHVDRKWIEDFIVGNYSYEVYKGLKKETGSW